jgi:hypothetical protein
VNNNVIKLYPLRATERAACHERNRLLLSTYVEYGPERFYRLMRQEEERRVGDMEFVLRRSVQEAAKRGRR